MDRSLEGPAPWRFLRGRPQTEAKLGRAVLGGPRGEWQGLAVTSGDSAELGSMVMVMGPLGPHSQEPDPGPLGVRCLLTPREMAARLALRGPRLGRVEAQASRGKGLARRQAAAGGERGLKPGRARPRP